MARVTTKKAPVQPVVGLSWSATAPWFPAEGTSLKKYLGKLPRGAKVAAFVEESTDAFFSVRVFSALCRVLVTFRLSDWRALTPAGRTKWVERDLRDGLRQCEAREARLLKSFSEDPEAAKE